MSARAALDLLRQGGLQMGPDWEEAHRLCQECEGARDHDLVHALCHWIEGDSANRDWWYRQLRPWVRAATIEAEWEAIAAELAKLR